MPENAILCFFGHFLGGDTMRGKIVFFEDESFARLVVEIRENYSNATNDIRLKMKRLLRENGYEMNDFVYLEGAYKLVERKQTDTMPIESRRIVSEGRKPISKEKVSAIIEMGLKGFSEREIAKELKVSKGTVGKYLKFMNPE